MTPTEAAAVLTYASAFDNRNVTPEAATAWAETLDVRMRPDDARWIIRDHYAATREWLMPSDLNRRFRDVRRERLLAAGDDYDMPAGLNPAEYDAARYAYIQAVGRGESKDEAVAAAWAAVGRDLDGIETGPPTTALAQLVANTQSPKETPA